MQKSKSRNVAKNAKTKAAQGNAPVSSVRIIGGQFKRRPLRFVDAKGLRPTPDRARETLFNWLMGHTAGAVALDTCAGSGALGIECVSRGGDSATLIEPNLAQAALLCRQIDAWGISDRVCVHAQTAQTVLPRLQSAFDIVFLDPPYALNLWQTLYDALRAHRLVHKDTLLYIEGDRPLEAMIAASDLRVLKERRIGQANLYLTRPK